MVPFLNDKPDLLHLQHDRHTQAIEKLTKRLLLDIDTTFNFSPSDALDARDYARDNVSVFRFLHQANFDFDTAHHRLLDTIRWRQQHQRALVHAWQGDGLAFFHKQDRHGRPVLVVRLAFFPSSTIPSFMDLVPIYVCRVMEEARRKLISATRDAAVSDQIAVVIDLGRAPFLPIDALFLKANLVDLVDRRFPGSVGSVYIMNFGWTYQGLWQRLAYLLDDDARSQVSFPSSSELSEIIPREFLLRELGGEDDSETPTSCVNLDVLLAASELEQDILLPVQESVDCVTSARSTDNEQEERKSSNTDVPVTCTADLESTVVEKKDDDVASTGERKDGKEKYPRTNVLTTGKVLEATAMTMATAGGGAECVVSRLNTGSEQPNTPRTQDEEQQKHDEITNLPTAIRLPQENASSVDTYALQQAQELEDEDSSDGARSQDEDDSAPDTNSLKDPEYEEGAGLSLQKESDTSIAVASPTLVNDRVDIISLALAGSDYGNDIGPTSTPVQNKSNADEHVQRLDGLDSCVVGLPQADEAYPSQAETGVDIDLSPLTEGEDIYDEEEAYNIGHDSESERDVDDTDDEIEAVNMILSLSDSQKRRSRGQSIGSSVSAKLYDATMSTLASPHATPGTATPTPASSPPSPMSISHFMLHLPKDVAPMSPASPSAATHLNVRCLSGIHTGTTNFLTPFHGASASWHQRRPSCPAVTMGIDSFVLARRLALLEEQSIQQQQQQQQHTEEDHHLVPDMTIQQPEDKENETRQEVVIRDDCSSEHRDSFSSPHSPHLLPPTGVSQAAYYALSPVRVLLQRLEHLLVQWMQRLFRQTFDVWIQGRHLERHALSPDVKGIEPDSSPVTDSTSSSPSLNIDY